MREIVNDKNDPDGIGICVYVAPTKALVNQVAGKRDLSSAIQYILTGDFFFSYNLFR